MLINFRIIIIIIFIFSFLSGCSWYKNNKSNNNDWKNEVLMAQECGLDGLPCCLDKEPPCFYGQQCCVDPNNPKHNACRDECSCGGLDEFCCKDNQCQEGLACRDGYCVECGDRGEACCPQEVCNNDLVCYHKQCVSCGLTGSPCCKNDKACLNQDDRDKYRNECQEGICILCGSSGQKACQSKPFCNPNNLLNNTFCYHCGAYNQPCCEGEKCDLGLSCQLGFCSK